MRNATYSSQGVKAGHVAKTLLEESQTVTSGMHDDSDTTLSKRLKYIGTSSHQSCIYEAILCVTVVL